MNAKERFCFRSATMFIAIDFECTGRKIGNITAVTYDAYYSNEGKLKFAGTKWKPVILACSL